jgi:hypothetical protein
VASAPSTAASGVPDAVVVTSDVRVHRRRGIVLLGLAVFQFWLWGTRIWNLVRDADDFSAAFVAVHAILYTAAIGAGVLLAVLGFRMWREAGRARAGVPTGAGVGSGRGGARA